jgi:hypothetical protein
MDLMESKIQIPRNKEDPHNNAEGHGITQRQIMYHDAITQRNREKHRSTTGNKETQI